MTPQELAEACAHELYRRDNATRQAGMTLEAVEPGKSVVRMTVRDDMVQGHKTCHGGYMFALADSAFAFACNTYNEPTVAIGCTIDYVAPALLGDVLTATATERSRSGRTGNYDVDIHNQEGRLIAMFHGKSYKVRGQILEHAQASKQENSND
ncbi:MAG: phenylacetic acid degradation protein PaaD [Oceanospirillaceae bacterium]|nr:phenylacetic acid degradation protein PaaD [Oceanospirillaceae bacterium]